MPAYQIELRDHPSCEVAPVHRVKDRDGTDRSRDAQRSPQLPFFPSSFASQGHSLWHFFQPRANSFLVNAIGTQGQAVTLFFLVEDSNTFFAFPPITYAVSKSLDSLPLRCFKQQATQYIKLYAGITTTTSREDLVLCLRRSWNFLGSSLRCAEFSQPPCLRWAFVE